MTPNEVAAFGTKNFGKANLIARVGREKAETQRMIDREMAYSADLRKQDKLDRLSAHMQHLDAILVAA